jgi:ribosomal-protein-alanine N-acetyltransferase
METAEKACLYTEQLLLRVLTPEVYRLVFTTYTDEEIKAFFGLASDEALLQEKEKYSRGMTTWNRSFRFFQLIDKLSKQVIGWCGYHTWYLQHARAELGYGIYDDAYKGMGLMTEALQPVVGYGFEQMGLNRIEAFVSPGNGASMSLLRRLGFQQEGRFREHFVKNGLVEDSIAFSLLKNEYQPARRQARI